jgi:predicted RNA-binding protein with RPS1 domain
MSLLGTDALPMIEVTTTAAVDALARDILDPEREHAVVCATLPTWSSEPLVDPAELRATLPPDAHLYVMATGDRSWELTDLLPPRLDVYGGAIRIWWPFGDEEPDPAAHPLFFVHHPGQSAEAIRQIAAVFARAGGPPAAAPQPGAEFTGVVTRVLGAGAELTLSGGYRAFAHKSRLTGLAGLDPDQVVRVGQGVRVRVGEGSSATGRIQVSLLPFEPDDWARLAEQYREGMVVAGLVDGLRNFGAFVEIYPGITGLLPSRRISRKWVSHAEDFLEVGERIAVQIVRIAPAEKRIELSLLDVPAGSEPERPASIYPEGPPWLPPLRQAPPPKAEPEPEPVAVVPPPTPPIEPVRQPEEPVEAVAPAEEAVEVAAASEAETEALERAIADGRELQTQVGAIFAGAERRIEELRAEAAQVRQILERDLAEARLRVLEFADSETKALAGSAEAALADARRELEDLRERLAAAEQDRLNLLDRLKLERERARDEARRTERLTKELRAERARADRLEDADGDRDPGTRFVEHVRRSWEQRTTAADRERYPWREPVLGPAFLESLDRVEGIRRERVVEACAHVASGRAADIPGLELHPLRTSETGGAPKLERADGAKAWRCSLQSNAPSARRLHFWRLPDGRVELAKVVYHDDYSIA